MTEPCPADHPCGEAAAAETGTLRARGSFIARTHPTRFALALIAILAGVAAALAALGLYAVLSTAVRQHTPEIGVRMAFGASRTSVLQHRSVRGVGPPGLEGPEPGMNANHSETCPCRDVQHTTAADLQRTVNRSPSIGLMSPEQAFSGR